MDVFLGSKDPKDHSCLAEQVLALKNQGRSASEIGMLLNLKDAKVGQLLKTFKIAPVVMSSLRNKST